MSVTLRSPRLYSLLGLTLLLVGCSTPPGDSVPDGAELDPGRASFEAVALPSSGTLGADPQTLAASLFGVTEPVEGNYREETMTLSTSPDQQVVVFTQLGLPDDSVLGIRHRLEFEPEGTQWQLTWAGRQVTCRPGRGHQDWSDAPCL
jgi:hypothetical protein